MNGIRKAVFTLRADIARNPDGCRLEELDTLLAEVLIDSDNDLVAACAIFDFPREAVEERAAILEFDGGLPHAAANRQAVMLVMRDRFPELTARAVRWLFDNSAAALSWAIATKNSRQETLEALWECLEMSMPGKYVAMNVDSGRMAAS